MKTSLLLRVALFGSAILVPALAASTDASAQTRSEQRRYENQNRSYDGRASEGRRRVGGASRFDGQWVAAFVTQRGNCEPSYALSLSISGGRIGSTQGGVSGRVDGSGRVNGVVSSQQGSARASGRLSQTAGQGRWNAASRGCTGIWTAQRSSM